MGILDAPPSASSYPFGKNINPGNFRRYRSALTKTLLGTKDTKILCLGDSTTAGYGNALDASFINNGSYPTRLAALLNSPTLPTAIGAGVPTSDISVDGRWTVGSGWTKSYNIGWGASSAYSGTVGTTGDLVYADPRVLADKFDVLVATSPGHGSVVVTATGGTATTSNLNNSTTTIIKITRTAATLATTNTLTFNGNTVGPSQVIHVEPYNSTKSTVRVANIGKGGSLATAWANSGGTVGAQACLAAYQPDLTIISLGINDSNVAVPASSYIAAITTMVNAALLYGDVLLMSMTPVGLSGYRLANIPAYRAALFDYIATTRMPFLDIASAIGSLTNGGNEGLAALGYTSDNLHLSDAGYGLEAMTIAKVLNAVV